VATVLASRYAAGNLRGLGSAAMFEAVHTERVSAAPAAVWELWADASRWPEWNEQLESGGLDGQLAVGARATVKFKRGGKMRFEVVAVEPERLFIDEAKLPGCRFGHEHRIEPAGSGSEITHRLYLEGPTSGLFARLFGRGRMEKSVVGYVERERELAE
jgi:Polyketide cyclase / dehydrase and lipid transport